MGVYFGGRIGQQYGAPAAGVAGSVAGMLAGEQLIKGSFKTGNPYAVAVATVVGSMAPIYGAEIAARTFGQPPQDAHKLAAWEAGVAAGMEKTASKLRRVGEWVLDNPKKTGAGLVLGAAAADIATGRHFESWARKKRGFKPDPRSAEAKKS